jgi:hypothetical protein
LKVVEVIKVVMVVKEGEERERGKGKKRGGWEVKNESEENKQGSEGRE